jgi:hypothetical protein
MSDNMNWHSAAKDYLARLGEGEWRAQGCPVPKERKGKLYGPRFCPSDYMCSLIDCLNKNDEEAFKALKMLQGYASSVKV